MHELLSTINNFSLIELLNPFTFIGLINVLSVLIIIFFIIIFVYYDKSNLTIKNYIKNTENINYSYIDLNKEYKTITIRQEIAYKLSKIIVQSRKVLNAKYWGYPIVLIMLLCMSYSISNTLIYFLDSKNLSEEERESIENYMNENVELLQFSAVDISEVIQIHGLFTSIKTYYTITYESESEFFKVTLPKDRVTFKSDTTSSIINVNVFDSLTEKEQKKLSNELQHNNSYVVGVSAVIGNDLIKILENKRELTSKKRAR